VHKYCILGECKVSKFELLNLLIFKTCHIFMVRFFHIYEKERKRDLAFFKI